MSSSTAETRTPPITRQLATWIAGLRFEDLPPAVVEQARACLLDALGAALFGASLPWSRLLVDFVARTRGQPQATVWGAPGLRTTMLDAVLANAAQVHSFEFDDVHIGSLHPANATVPVALAAGEAIPGLTGQDVLLGLVAGYEVGPRLGYALMPTLSLKGFHSGSVQGVIASTATAGRVLGLTADQLVHAFGLAAGQASGLLISGRGGMAKRFQAGRCSQSGLLAALLARDGYEGPEDALEAPYGGYCSSFSNLEHLDLITKGLGQDFEILNTHFKRYPCNILKQATMRMVRELMLEHGLSSDQVAQVRVRLTPASKLHVGWEYRPRGLASAQMNVYFGVAAVLRDPRAVADQYQEACIADPGMLKLIERVSVEAEPAWADRERERPARVTIVTVDGRSLEREVANGWAEGLTPSEVVSKFEHLASGTIGGDRVRQVQQLVASFEQLPDVSALTALLTA